MIENTIKMMNFKTDDPMTVTKKAFHLANLIKLRYKKKVFQCQRKAKVRTRRPNSPPRKMRCVDSLEILNYN